MDQKTWLVGGGLLYNLLYNESDKRDEPDEPHKPNGQERLAGSIH